MTFISRPLILGKALENEGDILFLNRSIVSENSSKT
jgi:hypothetical protein